MIKDHVKHYLLLTLTVFSVSLFCLPRSYANGTTEDAELQTAQSDAKSASDDADKNKTNGADALTQIAFNTYAYLKAFNAYSLSWLQPDTSTTTSVLQELFGNYVKYSFDNYQTQLNTQKQLVASSFLNPVSPNVDYTTLVKQNTKDSSGNMVPVSSDIKNYALQYVGYASGLNIKHHLPTELKGKNQAAVDQYIAFYNTMGSISTHNSYVLSEHLADLQSDFKLTQVQMDLKNTASNSDWVTHVSTETSISVLLRQLLLFTSQMYIVSLDSLETQKNLLASIAMTNTLIILGAGYYEDTLFNKAK